MQVGGNLISIEFKNNYVYSNLQDIFVRKDNKLLKIYYSGNGDLCLNIRVRGEENKIENGIRTSTFIISNEDEIYPYFDCLLNDIMNHHVSSLDVEVFGSTCNNLNQKLKEQNANTKLVHNGIVELFSESIYDEKANSLKIKRDCENIVLQFLDNDEDPTFGFEIRISNSGSRIAPFNICFMNLFKRLQEKYKSEQKIKKLF